MKNRLLLQGDDLTIRINNKKTVHIDLPTALFIFFFSFTFFSWAVKKIFELVGVKDWEEYGLWAALIVLYVPTFLLCWRNHRKELKEFAALLLGILAFWGITYLFHPEYGSYYFREQYGVLPYVLRPDCGIYAFLFVRLANDPEKIKHGLRYSGYIMYAFSLLELLMALNRGYWMEQDYLGHELRWSYSLNFGFTLVIFVCFFLHYGITNKSIRDLLLSFLGMGMILLGGSRAAFVNVGIFIVLYIVMRIYDSKNRKRNILIALGVIALTILLYRPILMGVAALLDLLHISSRTIKTLLNGAFLSSNGRNEIWAAAIDMIKENPFGYGFMGARHGLVKIHFVGHPHNVFLEMLIEYGVIFGTAIFILMLVVIVKVFYSKDIGEWRHLFLIYLGQTTQLLTSYTYWHSVALWSILAICLCIYDVKKQQRGYGIKMDWDREKKRGVILAHGNKQNNKCN